MVGGPPAAQTQNTAALPAIMQIPPHPFQGYACHSQSGDDATVNLEGPTLVVLRPRYGGRICTLLIWWPMSHNGRCAFFWGCFDGLPWFMCDLADAVVHV